MHQQVSRNSLLQITSFYIEKKCKTSNAFNNQQDQTFTEKTFDTTPSK